MEDISFIKYVATGNDFISLDNRKMDFSTEYLSELSQKMCKRKFSVGADGLLALENSDDSHIKMRIFNPDGSEVEMCGNGLRCIALYAQDLGLCDRLVSIETLAGEMKAEIKKSKVKTQFQNPYDIELNFSLDMSKEKKLTVNYVNTGVPHVVFFTDDVSEENVVNLGKKVRYHEKFQPEGTNVNFVEILDEENVKIRTYERGVEDETLACGTGAVASAVIGSSLNLIRQPVNLKTKSGDSLTVFLKKHDSEIRDVYIEGKVKKILKGRYENV